MFVASIVPFDFPVIVLLVRCSPFNRSFHSEQSRIALAVGNTIIVEPSENVHCALGLVTQLMKQAGLPDRCSQ